MQAKDKKKSKVKKRKAKKAEKNKDKPAPTMSLKSELSIIDWDISKGYDVSQNRLDRKKELQKLIKEADEKARMELVAEETE